MKFLLLVTFFIVLLLSSCDAPNLDNKQNTITLQSYELGYLQGALDSRRNPNSDPFHSLKLRLREFAEEFDLTDYDTSMTGPLY